MNTFVLQLAQIRKEKHQNYKRHYINTTDKKILAVQKIQNFYKNIFKSSCNIDAIKGIYRCRINFTTKHLLYSQVVSSSLYLFTWCFDINTLIKIYKCRLVIFGCVFRLLPNDCKYVEKIWHKTNGKTRTSIMFMSDMEYLKSCSKDIYKQLIN